MRMGKIASFSGRYTSKVKLAKLLKLATVIMEYA